MKNEDFEARFFQLLNAMGEFYGKTFSDIALEMWFNDVKRFSYEEIKRAFSIHRQNPDRGRFMPRPADIIGILEGSHKSNAYLAWTKFIKAVERVGVYQSVRFDDPIIHKVVDDMGGWIFLCEDLTDENRPFVCNDFKSRYQDYKTQGGVFENQPDLIGLHEQENRQKNLIDYKPEDPILIGDKSKALQLKNNTSDSVLSGSV